MEMTEAKCLLKPWVCWLHKIFMLLVVLQGWMKQFHIGQAKYKQHVRHLNAKVALEHASQENSVILSGKLMQ